MKYLDTRNQLADFCQGELSLMTNDNIFSVFLPSCTNKFLAAVSAIKLAILFGMWKLQMQETQHGEEDARGVEKSRPTRDLFALAPNQSSNVPSSSSALHSWREQEQVAQVWIRRAQGDSWQRI